jgi:hypothetical protein
MTLSDRTVRYLYIHIWSSGEEVRAKCTNPATLESIIRAVNRNRDREEFKDIEIKHHQDISGYLHVISIKGFDDETQYPRLAWWMFRALCDKGWEPMSTGQSAYKMKRRETLEDMNV